MSGCHGNKIVPLLGGSSQAKEHQKGSASAPESHGVVMGSDLHKRLGVSSHAWFGYTASRLKSNDQFRTYSRGSGITKASRRPCTCVCVSVTVT